MTNETIMLGDNITIEEVKLLKEERRSPRYLEELEKRKKQYAKVLEYVETYEEKGLKDPYELAAAKKLLKEKGLL